MEAEACFLERTQEKSHDWRSNPRFRESWRTKDVNRVLSAMWEYPIDESAVAEESVEETFRKLAAKWAEETGHVSSLTTRINHPAYRAIVALGWDVVPLLIADLQKHYRFWFDALHEITGINPFDNADVGNIRRMTSAWIQWWDKKKQLERKVEIA